LLPVSCFREKFVTLQLSTFATQSALSGRQRCPVSSRFLGLERNRFRLKRLALLSFGGA
jgi:hypothetical protein